MALSDPRGTGGKWAYNRLEDPALPFLLPGLPLCLCCPNIPISWASTASWSSAFTAKTPHAGMSCMCPSVRNSPPVFYLGSVSPPALPIPVGDRPSVSGFAILKNLFAQQAASAL